MKIIDRNGEEIEVTDLRLAIAQVDNFRHYSHEGLVQRKQDHHPKAYWQDFYEKLLLLQSGPEKTG